MILLSYGRRNSTIGTRLPPAHAAVATIAPGTGSRRTFDINHFPYFYGHMHQTLLYDAPKRLGITLTGELQLCTGCAMHKKVPRVIVDDSEKECVASVGDNHYIMVIRDDYTRFAWL